jgi:hypothetical protein
MKRVWFVSAAVLAMTVATASAQNTVRRSSSSSYQTEPRVDLIPMAGFAWTMAMDVYANGYPGELDFSDEVYYGGALDFTVSPPGSMKTAQVRLMYRRSDGQVELRGNNFLGEDLSVDAAVEYWHIGGVTGMMKGKSMPFATVSLGGTRLVAGDQDEWKFSMIFGLGVKVYTSPKMGILLQGNWPITFTDTWGGAYVGTGGAGVSIGGTGISQLDLGGGLIIRF